MEPIVVHYGPDRARLLIADGASALGYLFSICKLPVAKSLSWYAYWLPSLLLYSRCLYLAFVAADEGNLGKYYFFSGVPVMANVMYLPIGLDQSHSLMFGSTLPSVSLSSKEDTLVVEQTRLAYVWRRKNILESALNDLHPGATLPGVLHPPVLDELRKRLNLLVIGRRTAQQAIELPLCTEMFQVSNAMATEIYRSIDNKQYQLIKQPKLATDGRSAEQMELLFRNLFQLRFSRNYRSDDRKYVKAWRDLLRFYVTPRFHPVSGTDEEQKIPIPVHHKYLQRIESLLDDKLPQIINAATQKLDCAVQERDEDGGRHRKIKTGRCAETYPVVCIG